MTPSMREGARRERCEEGVGGRTMGAALPWVEAVQGERLENGRSALKLCGWIEEC